MNRNKFALLSKLAKRAEKPMAKRFVPILEQEVRDAVSEVRKGHNLEQALLELEILWQRKSAEAQTLYALAYAVHGYKMAGAWMGQKCFIDEMVAKAQFAVEVDVEMWGSDLLTANHLRPDVGAWIEKTSKFETATSSQLLAKLYKEAFEANPNSPNGIADQMLKQGLTMSEVRARMMARTMTNWAYNEGAVMNYADHGITKKEWLVTEDDALCPLCRPLNGKIVEVRGNYLNEGQEYSGEDGTSMTAKFDIPHAPLHPNCRCTILPVLDGWE